MKIGFVQFSPILGSCAVTIVGLESLIRQSPTANLLVLPELCNSGYNFKTRQEAWESSVPVDDSVFLQMLAGICAERHCHIVTGFNERAEDKLYNSAVLISPTGVVGSYRKLHLFQNEKDIFEPGNLGLPVFDIGSAKIGMLICFDWRFPEVWRILALKGADIICHPSNLVVPDMAQRGVPGHALMNRVYTITANRTGTERDLTFTGRSIICNTVGEVIAGASADEACVRVVEIDLATARNKNTNLRNNIFTDRRPAEYELLCRPTDSN